MLPKSTPLLLTASLMLAGVASHAVGQASIEGTVQISAKPMSPPPDARYALKAGQIAPSPKQVAVVYLEGNFGKSAPQRSLVMQQKGYQFSPGVLAVQTGTSIVFPNGDDDYHNVFSYSKPKRFDLGRFRKEETPPALVFDKPGIVRLYCEIHSHMRGIILVLDTPHFATTGEDGRFKLSGLPAGNFTLKAWLDEETTLEQPVTLKAGQALHVNFSGTKLAASR